MNSGYSTNVVFDEASPSTLPQQLGNKTECALLGFVHLLGVDYRKLRRDVPESNFVKGIIFKIVNGLVKNSRVTS